jgi:hypothetical protein
VQDPNVREPSFLERLSLLLDRHWDRRENQALARRLKSAKLAADVLPDRPPQRSPHRDAPGFDEEESREAAEPIAFAVGRGRECGLLPVLQDLSVTGF